MGAGLRCEFRVTKGALTPVQIERLGETPSIQPKADHDLITFWLRSIKQNDTTQLANLLGHTQLDEPERRAKSA